MQLFSSIPNWIEPRGFLFGWEPAALGNSLSCAANLVAFAIRTGIPVFYPNIDASKGLFRDPQRPRTLFDPEHRADIAGFIDLNNHIEKLFWPGFTHYQRGVDTIGLDQLPAFHEARQIVLMLPYVQRGIGEWTDQHRELLASSFCRKGNGLIYPGAYWLQYKDMRTAAEYGPALRAHLGDLRKDGCEARNRYRDRMPGLKIGIHIRHGDYRVWNGGKYYFTLSEYKHVMAAVHASLHAQAHAFYVCSDANLNAEDFGNLPVYHQRADAMDDFLCLSECDYVLGPPSTFSTWAAFLGHGKRLVLTRDRVETVAEAAEPLAWAIDIGFPTGAYLPGDETGGPI